MQRIKLEILTEVDKSLNNRLWVLELIEDDDGNFGLYRHYGKEKDTKFIKMVDLVTEHIDEGLQAFEDKISRKLARGEYRKFKNGEGSDSVGLLAIFRPVQLQPKPVVRPMDQPEHRRLSL